MTTALLLVAPLFLTTTAAVPRYAHLTANAVIQLDDRLSIAAKTGSFGRSAFRSTGTYSAIHTGSQHDEHHFGCGALPRVDPNAPDGYPTLYVLARGNCTFVAKAAAAAAAGASAVVVYDSIPGMYFPFIASEGGDGGGASLSSTLSASACAYDCAAGSSIINASEVNLASALGGYRGRCGDASSCPSQLCALASPSGRATLPHPPGVRALCCVVNALMDMGTAEGADLAQLGGITAAFVSVGGGAALLEALNTSHTTSTPLIVRLIPAAHEERARGAKESPVGRLADAAAQSLLLWFAAAVIAIAALQSELRAISKWGPGLRCVVDDDAPSQSDDLRAGGSQIVDSGRLEPSQSGEAASPSLLGTGVAATSETAVLPSTGAGVGAARAPHDSNAVRLIEPVNAPGDFSAQWRELQSAISRDLIVMSTAISTSFRNLDLAAHPNSPGSSSDSPGDSVATQQASPSTPAMTTAPYTSVALAAPSLPTPHTDPSERAVGGAATGALLESASTGTGSAHADSNDGATASTIIVPGDNGPSAPSVRGSATTPTFPGHNRSLYSAMRDYTIAVPNGPFAQVMHRWAGWVIAPPALVLALLALIVLIALLLAVLALFLALIFAIIVSPALLVYALMVYSMSSIPRFGDVLLILFAFTFQVALATKYMRPLVVAVWPGAATIVLYRGSNSARSVIDMNARNAASDSHAPQAAPPVSSNSGSNSSSSTTRATPSASRLTLACLLAFILTVAITAAPTLLGENSPGMWILTDALSLAWCALLISGLDLSLRGLAKWFGFVVAAVAWFPVFRATDSALGLKGRVDSSVATLPTTRGEQLIQCGEGGPGTVKFILRVFLTAGSDLHLPRLSFLPLILTGSSETTPPVLHTGESDAVVRAWGTGELPDTLWVSIVWLIIPAFFLAAALRNDLLRAVSSARRTAPSTPAVQGSRHSVATAADAAEAGSSPDAATPTAAVQPPISHLSSLRLPYFKSACITSLVSLLVWDGLGSMKDAAGGGLATSTDRLGRDATEGDHPGSETGLLAAGAALVALLLCAYAQGEMRLVWAGETDNHSGKQLTAAAKRIEGSQGDAEPASS